MVGPEVQAAIYASLTTAQPPIAGGRVYDQVPANAVFPYVTIGDEQVTDAGDACGDAWDVFADLHVWSRPESGSKGEAKGLAQRIVPVLLGVDAAGPFQVKLAVLETYRVFRDGDGLTEHGVMTFRFLLTEA